MTLTTPAPPHRRRSSPALPAALGLAALLGAGLLQAPQAQAANVSGTATLAPGPVYNAQVGDSFDLDFSGIFTDPAMNVGNYWQFQVTELAGNASYANLGWEVQYGNSGTWVQVPWDSLDPMGATTSTTVPALDGSNNFPANTNTITLGLNGFGTTLTSGLLAKANYQAPNPVVTDVRMVGTVNGATTPYKTTFSISDVIWGGPGSGNAPDPRNAYEADLSNVPGPLPVLGAIGALGMARQLRRRVRQVTPA